MGIMQKYVMNTAAPIAAGVLSILLGGCGSKLPRERTINTPFGIEQAIDLSQVIVTDMDSQEKMSVKDYMQRSQKDYLFLVFGSRACTACNEEGTELRDRFINKHALYQTDAGRRFEVIGINTDPGRDRDLVLEMVAETKFTFIKWLDPGAKVMTEFFLPQGAPIKVPLVVMLRKGGIAWRFTATERPSFAELIAKIEATLNGGDATAGTTASPLPPSSKPPEGPKPPVKPSLFSVEGPQRFKGLALKACDGTDTNLEVVAGQSDIRFVNFVRGPCDASCTSNHIALQQLARRCVDDPSSVNGQSCTATTAIGKADEGSSCDMRNGFGLALDATDSIFSSWESHFNWAFDRSSGKVPAMGSSFVLGFSKAGKLVYSSEGRTITEDDLVGAMTRSDWGRLPDAAAFPFYTYAGGIEQRPTLRDFRENAYYTVVNVVGRLCASCIEELILRNKPNRLFDQCQSRPGKCQMIAMEYTRSQPADIEATWLEISSEFTKYGIRTPLFLDPETTRSKRFFEGYLRGSIGKSWPGPGTVIYDREGKIVWYEASPARVTDDHESEAALKVLLDSIE